MDQWSDQNGLFLNARTLGSVSRFGPVPGILVLMGSPIGNIGTSIRALFGAKISLTYGRT